MKRQPNTPVTQKKPRKPRLNRFPFSVESFAGSVILLLPVRTVSEANNFDHHMIKHKRHKSQQRTVKLALSQVNRQIVLPCHIILTRYAQRKLDKHDNLPMSLKYILDEICFFITGKDKGKGDDDARISVAYDQVLSKDYGVKIEIQSTIQFFSTSTKRE